MFGESLILSATTKVIATPLAVRRQSMSALIPKSLNPFPSDQAGGKPEPNTLLEDLAPNVQPHWPQTRRSGQNGFSPRLVSVALRAASAKAELPYTPST